MTDLKFDLANFKVDDDKKKGVWVDFGGDARFKIASMDTPAFTDAFRKRIEPYQELNQEPGEDAKKEIMARTMAEHVVLGWEGVFEHDEEVAFSVEAAFRVLMEFDPVRDRLIEKSRDYQTFKADAKKAAAKN